MVRNLIEEDNASVRKHPFNKKHKLKVDVMTYGALALACTTREMADKLLNEMKEKQLKYGYICKISIKTAIKKL